MDIGRLIDDYGGPGHARAGMVAPFARVVASKVVGVVQGGPLRGLRQRRSEEIQPVRAQDRLAHLSRDDRPYFIQVSHGLDFYWTFLKPEASI